MMRTPWGMERIGKVQIEHRYEYIDKYVAVQSWPALSAPFILQKIFAVVFGQTI